MSDGPSVLLNIRDMIDLSIGTPEVGVVDFNMLHTVLHCMAQQLHILEKNVEIRGSLAAIPFTKDNINTVSVNEFIVNTDEQDTDKEVKTYEPAEKISKPDTLLIVERVKKAGHHVGAPAVATNHSPSRTSSDMGTQQQYQMLHQTSSTARLSLVTTSKFHVLENTVEDLRNRVYGSIPKNDQILEEVRSQTNLKAITDMWTSLNVSSRLEAAEEGITKLSSLVQDLISETSGLQGIQRSGPQIEKQQVSEETTAVSAKESKQDDYTSLKIYLDKMRADLDKLTKLIQETVGDIEVAPDLPDQTYRSDQADSADSTPITQAAKSQTGQRPQPQRALSTITVDLMERVNDLERKLEKCCQCTNKSEGEIQDQIDSLQEQLEYLMKQVAALSDETIADKLSPDLTKNLQGLMELFTTVQDMQDQLKQVHETALQLAVEKDDRQHNMNALLEQIELLKTIKLDREDMMEAMAEKADLRMLARKVSQDRFEVICDDLSKGLETTLGKLNLQEALWQQALDDIQREIEMKLDKLELSPVKEFFNDKLRQLQENLKQMASLRREAEAAGTKRKLLRDVKCISCDANAVMTMDAPSTVPISKPLPASISMKPYLSYELDTIRKAQQTSVLQRNMHDWEVIDKQMTQTKQPKQKTRTDTEKHLCNRYCGGSHTVTTAAQRVARLGHFIRQWGPDVLPLSSGFTTGDDGRLYKVSTVEEANTGTGEGAVDPPCTAKPTSVKSEKPRTGPKTINISTECRCLEEDRPVKG
ncbi:hypothetical protein ACJJTC_009827 [Scirpophaga incertulas]